MKLPRPSIRKLFREDFSQADPIVVDRSRIAAESKRWREQVSKIDGVQVTQHPGDKDSRSRTLCRFTIPNPRESGSYWRSDELRLEFDQQSRLTLHWYEYRNSAFTALVSEIDEIRQFVRHVLERYARRHAGEVKREKIRQFKSKAIIAQVQKLAKEEQFDFATACDTVKLKLYVRLSKHDLIEIHVPFKQFEKVLPTLKNTILSLRALYADGLRFKMVPSSRLPWDLKWIRGESLP